MKSLIILFFLIVSTHGYAQTNTSKMYDEVQKMFDAGTTLTTESMRGVYSGRCFQKIVDDNKKVWYSDTQQAIFKATPYPGDNAGPAFPDAKRNTIEMGTMPMYPTFNFDDFKAKDFDLKIYLPGGTRTTGTTSDGKTLRWTSHSGDDSETLEYSARRYANYIVFSVNQTKYDNQVVAPNEAKYACYFFKKLP